MKLCKSSALTTAADSRYSPSATLQRCTKLKKSSSIATLPCLSAAGATRRTGSVLVEIGADC